MTTRLHAVSQAADLYVRQRTAATAFLLTAGVPLIVELWCPLDAFAVNVIGVLTGRLRRIFGDADSTSCGSCGLMTGLLLAAILAPLAAPIASLITGR